MKIIIMENCGMRWEGPEILSKRDNEYCQNFAVKLKLGDIETLCKILMNPKEKIFTPDNLRDISHYALEIDGWDYIFGFPTDDLLVLIHRGRYEKDEVLYDTAMMAPAKIKRQVLRYLSKHGLIRILTG